MEEKMANRKKETPFIGYDEIIETIAQRRKFTKKDVKEILDELKLIFEECVQENLDIDINGLIHMKVMDMNYKKPPGIVGFHGKKDFKKNTKRIVYSVPANMKELLRSKQED